MAYNIKPLSNSLPEEGKTYLFDANIWILVLLSPPNLSAEEQLYLDFFQGVFNLSINDACRNKPKMYVSGMLLSEVINAGMRIHLDTFNSNQMDEIKMKAYRATASGKAARAALLSDISIYQKGFVVEDAILCDCYKVAMNIPEFSDYNDYYYYHAAKAQNMTIVTMDHDFKFEDVEIITEVRKLLRLMTPPPNNRPQGNNNAPARGQ